MNKRTFTTTDMDAFNSVIYAAIVNGLTFESSFGDGEYTIVFTGGY